MVAFAEEYVQSYDVLFRVGWRFPMADSSDPIRIGDAGFQEAIDTSTDAFASRFGCAVVPLQSPETAVMDIEREILRRLAADTAPSESSGAELM